MIESPYPKNKVPRELFRKEPDNSKSELYNTCSDCRKYESRFRKEKLYIKKEQAVSRGNFFCTHCHHEKDISERALNLDGTPSILCNICKEVERERSLNNREIYNKIKLEMIEKTQCSCVNCKCLYFQPLCQHACR